MYEILIKVDDLNVKLIYTNVEKALKEFKDCVHELLTLSQPDDDIILKLNSDYGICILQNDKFEYKLEMKPKGDE